MADDEGLMMTDSFFRDVKCPLVFERGALLLGIDLNSLDVDSLLGPLGRREYFFDFCCFLPFLVFIWDYPFFGLIWCSRLEFV